MTLQQEWESAFLSNYATPSIELVRGVGSRVWDSQGNSYLDLVAGIAVSSLGHGHPAVVDAVTSQVGQIAHTSNLYANQPALALAKKLQAITGQPCKVFFCNDGATANEAAFKLARKHGKGTRLGLVSTDGAFHGRTAAALALTGQPGKRSPFEPLPGDVVFVPYGDSEALQSVITTTTSAVILEPIQGEAGVHPAPAGYLAAARQACDDAGALLIMDEVQTGMGRTGNWFASLAAGVVPDVMTLAKGLGGGLPIGAVIAFGSAADLFVPGDHGSTFGGNPVSCAAALAVIDTIESQGLLEHVGRMGAHLSESILALQHDNIAGVRGLGLLQAVVLQGVTGSAVEAAARAKGFLVNAVAPDAIRLAPPLVITQVEIDEFVQALPQILTEATS
jgi:acetylornithine aminotransferase